MHKRYDIAIEDLRDLLSYNCDTGDLIWRPRPLRFCKDAREQSRWNSRCANKIVKMTIGSSGYQRFKLFDVVYRSHRVCWALHYGEWPEKQIDHINCIPDDNRIVNLREATPSQNAANQRKIKPKTSRLKGAFFNKASGKWLSRIIHEGTVYNLGSFNSDVAAHAAYCAKGMALRGEFFRA